MSDCVRYVFLPAKVKIRRNANAHDEYFYTFIKFESLSRSDNSSANEPDHVGHDWSGDDVGHIPMDRARRQLPDDPTVFQCGYSLVIGLQVVL